MFPDYRLACMEEVRNAYKVLICTSEGKTRLWKIGVDGRTILKWVLNIGCEGVDSFVWHKLGFSGVLV